MGSKRDNLVLAKTNFTGTYYQDKSYHKRLIHFDPRSSSWNQSRTFTFSMDDGKWCAPTKPRRNLSGAEINRFR